MVVVFISRNVLFYQYGLIIKDKTMGIVNLIGILINCCYLVFYALWSDRDSKKNFLSSLKKGIIFIIAVIVYAQLENSEKLRFRFGMITTVYMFLLIGSPLLSLVSFFIRPHANDANMAAM